MNFPWISSKSSHPKDGWMATWLKAWFHRVSISLYVSARQDELLVQAPVVTNDSHMPLLSPCPLDTWALVLFSGNEDMAQQRILWCLQCFCWHSLEHYLTALQPLHWLKGLTPPILAQNLQAWDLGSLATPCPVGVASPHFPTHIPSYIPLQSDPLNHIWSNVHTSPLLLTNMYHANAAVKVMG